MSAARIFPSLVPLEKDIPSVKENKDAWKRLKNCGIPFLLCFGEKDDNFKGESYEKYFKKTIRSSQGLSHRRVPNAGHFIQDDAVTLLYIIGKI